jgi:flagellar hook protein FlgE
MSLNGALSSSVSGLNSKGIELATVADNISNMNTYGFKSTEAVFSTLVTQASSSKGYSSGGVNTIAKKNIDKQGLLQSTSRGTDLAVSGKGFFVVNSQNDLNGNFGYTRAGSFEADSSGNLRNSAGFYLLGWQLDSEGRLPGAPGNLKKTSSALLESLDVVNVKAINGSATATSLVNLGINLQSSQSGLRGIGGNIAFANGSTNSNIGANTVIAPDDTPGMEFNIGDVLTVTPEFPGTTYKFTYGGVAMSKDVSGGMLGAVTPNMIFANGANDGDSLTIFTPDTGEVKFSLVASSPIASKGQFNSLSTLAEAIDFVQGLSARVVNNRLLISATNANNKITFSDTGSSSLKEVLGLQDIESAVGSTNRFSTLEGLSKLVSLQQGISSSIANPLDDSSISIFITDPLGRLTIDVVRNQENIENSTTGVADQTNFSSVTSTANSIKNQLGLVGVPMGQTIGPIYNPQDSTKNMSNGATHPHFSNNVRLFDSLGTGHDFRVSFVKTQNNTWAAEIYAMDKSDIITNREDGLVAFGNIEFNGDGSLRNVDSSLSNPVQIVWANKSLAGNISFNWGDSGDVQGTIGASFIGQTNGLRQLDSQYLIDFVSQNGIESGVLNGIEFDESGFVSAKYTNGTSRKLYRVPLADFTSVNHLDSRPGNVYVDTIDSGNFNLRSPLDGGIGKISPGTLELANVELSDELTRMIVAQRGYQANSTVIRTVNQMLEELNRII